METGLQKEIEIQLSSTLNKKLVILSANPVSGGCISNAQCLQTNYKNYFLKYNNGSRFPGMFSREANGLKLLAATGAVKVPEPLLTGSYNGIDYIVLTMLERSVMAKDYYEKLGFELAELHRNHSEFYGLDHDNYIGSLKQNNHLHPTAHDFYTMERFMPQIKIAEANNLLPVKTSRDFEKLFRELSSLIPDEKPSLLHGDLWNGNVITGPDGYAWLIDPAVYYGCRESDLAMTLLFGGFDQSFYESYESRYPLYSGWENRVELFQLYPLLVHLNLFGKNYLPQIDSALKKYV